MVTTEWRLVREDRWDAVQLAWNTWDDDLLLRNTGTEDVLTYQLLWFTEWESYNNTIVVWMPLETDWWLLLQNESWQTLVGNVAYTKWWTEWGVFNS